MSIERYDEHEISHETSNADLEALRTAFATNVTANAGEATESCPEAERFWAAVHGELPADEVRQMATHTATCTSCAEAWRLALHLGEEAGTLPSIEEGTASTAEATTEKPTTEKPQGRVLSMAHRFRRQLAPLAGLAAAAALLLMVALPDQTPPDGPPEYRQGEEEAIRSLLAEQEPQPRGALRLRWSGPEGARYSLLVTTQDLTVIAEVTDLENTEYLVPEASLASVAAGTTLLWQVEATLPDGSHQNSTSFEVRLE